MIKTKDKLKKKVKTDNDRIEKWLKEKEKNIKELATKNNASQEVLEIETKIIVKFDDEKWYEGLIDKGKTNNIHILYDDDTESY